jgi:histidinol-phosphate phosphatase family protein
MQHLFNNLSIFNFTQGNGMINVLSMPKNIKQAVILAGGRGTRLAPITNTIPKPMVPINGRPFLEYLVELLRKNGIEKILLLLGYLPEKVVEHFGDGKKFGVDITYSITDVDDDTGTRIKKAATLLDDQFLLLYSDNYWPLDLAKMVAFHDEKKTLGMMTVYNNRDGGGEYGLKNNVRVEDDGLVSLYGYKKEELPDTANAIDAGSFIMPKTVLDLIPNENVSFQATVLPKLIAQRQLAAFRMDHPYYFITSVAHLPTVEKFFAPKKVVFLDRDGVINKKAEEGDYVKRWDNFKFLPGAAVAVGLLTKAGYQIYLISNQRGIARGLMTEADLADIHGRMAAELAKAGGHIDGLYHCPHGREEKCFCRKPQPGMLFKAARERHLDLTKTVMIGDRASDVAAAEAAGCRAILAKEGDLLPVVQSLLRES